MIQNPGSLLQGLTTDDLKRDPHPSRKRNPLIAEVASYDHWVERAGTGTTRMIQLCDDAGLPAPDFDNLSSGFKVTFRRDVLTLERLAAFGLSPDQIRGVLHVKAHGSITNREYREITGVSARKAVQDLSDLTATAVLMKEGAGRSVPYTLPKRP